MELIILIILVMFDLFMTICVYGRVKIMDDRVSNIEKYYTGYYTTKQPDEDDESESWKNN